jgi:hypothetical protein
MLQFRGPAVSVSLEGCQQAGIGEQPVDLIEILWEVVSLVR